MEEGRENQFRMGMSIQEARIAGLENKIETMNEQNDNIMEQLRALTQPGRRNLRVHRKEEEEVMTQKIRWSEILKE